MASLCGPLNLSPTWIHVSAQSGARRHRKNSILRENAACTSKDRSSGVSRPPFSLTRPRASASGLDNQGASPSPFPTPGPSKLEDMISANKVLKSHIGKLAVFELRHECELAGISADGLKADLVDRLLKWATDEATKRHTAAAAAAQKDNRNTSSTSSSGNSSAAAGEAQTSSQTAAAPSPATGDASAENAKNISGATATAREKRRSTTEDPSSASASASSLSATDIRVQWLGTSSGAPTGRRNVSSIAVLYGPDRIFLVDCGEGTRNQMRSVGLNPALVTHIFITHLHGDHCFGLPGTIAAISAARAGTPLENEPIEVRGPPELHRLMLAACRAAQMQLTVPVVLKSWVFDPAREAPPEAVDPGKMLHLGFQPPDQAGNLPASLARSWQSAYDGGSDQVVRQGLTWTTKLPGGVVVTSAQLQHRMPCWGYVFDEPASSIAADAVSDFTKRRMAAVAQAADARHPGNSNAGGNWDAHEDAEDTAGDGAWIRPGRKLVLLGDTCDSTAIADIARGCDVLSHEATFQKGMEEKARIATHSTSEQAGLFAKQIRAKNLVLTHFSARYEQSDKYQKVWAEAKQKGKSMKEMHVSNVAPLAAEAKEAAGSARVFLANDFFTFKVPQAEPVPEEMYEQAKKIQRQRLAQSLSGQAADAGPMRSNNDWRRDDVSGGRRPPTYSPRHQGGGPGQQQRQQRGGYYAGGQQQRRGSY